MQVGDVIRARRWNHCEPSIELSYSVGRGNKNVAVFLYLGTEPRDGSNPLDLEGRMKELGWVPNQGINNKD
jgi:hypothetical protein